ncbi:hypothetical protein P8935_12080 [Telmatobacter sp. DSM 110680]|uniref:Right handed beta helix domain-containing protein n=1 Tax=Telmatobacter sp. DSM 110680 TaxID=3036704 RepID=A0AAU7DPE2_9BACT
MARYLSRLVVLPVVLLCAVGFSLPCHAAGTSYYINNLPGSNCSDGGAHTMAQPWCTFDPANRLRSFSAGDQILLVRGGFWDQELSLAGRGTLIEPVTLGAYGTGPSPKILRNQAVGDICVLLTDPSYWKISDLEVGRASVGILLHFTQLFNNGVAISNIDAHDNKGIWAGHSTEYPVSHHVIDPFASSLNINLSSGILFNVAAYVTYSSSQYVLKGVTVSDVRGTNNLDSVAFDAESNTIDNQDGHNAFQDVKLNGLILTGDNGDAAKAYARAGLGCSDSLRLLGMTNVTVMNSVLFDEAGCHTETGTAAVILGRVSHVTFVNNIIFGVPASGSPDETAIDLEWSEDHVSLLANLFAENAGPAVEILNIHGGDHSSDLDFSGNTFVQNACARRPGAAGVWEDNKGRGYGTPVGKIRNNLYFEPHGKFFGGRNVGSVSDVNNVGTIQAASFAAEQFSATQGQNNWRYLHETADGSWANLPTYAAGNNNGAWEAGTAQYVSAFNMAPVTCTNHHNCGGVAREWIASRAGTIRIRGRVIRSDGQAGSGVRAAVNLVSGGNTTLIWPLQDGKQLIPSTDQMGYETDVDDIHVFAGDVIRFEVHASGDRINDAVSWTPSIGYVGSSSKHTNLPQDGL